MSKIYVVHGCGVKNISEETEWLDIQAMLRVEGLIAQIRSDTAENIVVLFSGWNVGKKKWQKHSEAYHMRQYFEQRKAELTEVFAAKNIQVVMEESAINSIRNVHLTIDEAKKYLDEETRTISIVSSDFHIPRLLSLYKNYLKGTGDLEGISLEAVYAMSLLKWQEDLSPEVQDMLLEWRNRWLFTKAREQVVELVWRTFSFFGLDHALAHIPSDTPLRKVPFAILKKRNKASE